MFIRMLLACNLIAIPAFANTQVSGGLTVTGYGQGEIVNQSPWHNPPKVVDTTNQTMQTIKLAHIKPARAFYRLHFHKPQLPTISQPVKRIRLDVKRNR